jgi:hypothetical protein
MPIPVVQEVLGNGFQTVDQPEGTKAASTVAHIPMPLQVLMGISPVEPPDWMMEPREMLSCARPRE